LGLYNVGDVPFHQVYIHPKILDGYGEGMSKSKGNGVDPLDVIEKIGADSLRFSLAYLTTETQDVRMPVEFECPHCGALVEQTKKNRVLPRIECPKCGGAFSTQWASKPDDLALPRGPVVSERFELGRNFCNKLWNAARFALLNLENFSPGPVADDELAVEDRWILSRLATVTRQTTESLEGYRYADAARVLYDFAWNEFCSFYVEMVKGRLQDAASRATAARVLAHTLDVLVRLLHPMIPFITEEIWQLLGQSAPERGLGSPVRAADSIMIAPWPQADLERQDAQIEARFAHFQEVLKALRDIRSRQNIPPKTPVSFSVRSDPATAQLLQPLAPYFQSMAGARATGWGPQVVPPATAASTVAGAAEVFVDLAGLIDVAAETARQTKELARISGAIAAKERQLANENFVSRAPAEVIDKERAALDQLKELHATTAAALEKLASAKK
jgi:valyl-tRNA synthetase